MISLVYHYYIKLDFSLNISINKFIIWFEVLSVRCAVLDLHITVADCTDAEYRDQHYSQAVPKP